MALATTERLAANARAELARQRLSRRKVAADLGWATSTLQRRLNGETPFNVDELAAFAMYLNVSTTALIGEDERQQGSAA